MTKPQAISLMARLTAAYPYPKIEPATAAIYVEAFERLRNYDQAYDAVNRLIVAERMLPRVADVFDTYHSLKGTFDPPALDEAPLSEEQKAENLRMAREMAEKLRANGRDTGFLSMPQLDFVEADGAA